jgi:hypothetical protein
MLGVARSELLKILRQDLLARLGARQRLRAAPPLIFLFETDRPKARDPGVPNTNGKEKQSDNNQICIVSARSKACNRPQTVDIVIGII